MTTTIRSASPYARPMTPASAIIDFEDAIDRIDGLLDVLLVLDWSLPTLHDGKGITAVAASALTHVEILRKALAVLKDAEGAR